MVEDNEEVPNLAPQIKDFAEYQDEKSDVIKWLIVFSAISIALITHTVYSLYTMATDNSIPLVVCPRTYDLDRPVLLNTIEATDATYVQDRWIRGFSRTFVQSLFPRTKADVSRFFTYVRDHSEGRVAYKYQSYLDDIDGIEERINNGSVLKFYPKAGDGFRIRPTQKSGRQTEWAVEIDGYLNRGYENNSERTLPKVRMTVQSTVPTRVNPEGLVVTELIIDDTIADLMSGRQKDDTVKENK